MLWRAIIDCAEMTTIAADATKFDRSAPVRIAAPDAFHRLVTDTQPSGPLATLLGAAGIEVILA